MREILIEDWSSATQEQIDASAGRLLHELQLRDAADDRSDDKSDEEPFPPAPVSWRQFVMIPTAVAVILAVVLAITWRQDAFAVVEKVNGTLYRVVDGKNQPLHVGETVDIGTPVRTEDRSGAVLKLADGARVEIHEKSEISLEHAQDGTHIRLNTGSVNVTPSTQPERNLHVQNKEVTVPVVGALFQAVTPVATQTPAAQQPTSTSSPNRAEARETLPRFEVVSVRPCDSNAPAPGGGRGSNSGPASPVRLRLVCESLFSLIHTAYGTFANGRMNAPGTLPADPPFESRPGWMLTERFTVEATTAEALPIAVMQGPMLQAVLEDRFKLKVRRETREAPISELVVRRGGHKLTPFKPGTCVPLDWSSYPLPPLDASQRRCYGVTGREDNNWVLTVEGLTLDGIASIWSGPTLQVVNKTGITGLFSFRLVYNANESSLYPPFRDAVQDQLGLEFRPATGLRDFLVIDHVERPTPN